MRFGHNSQSTHKSAKDKDYLMQFQSFQTQIQHHIQQKSHSLYDHGFLLWEQRESNPRPSACKADALNQLSYAPF